LISTAGTSKAHQMQMEHQRVRRRLDVHWSRGNLGTGVPILSEECAVLKNEVGRPMPDDCCSGRVQLA
jgi:hypothetical protein